MVGLVALDLAGGQGYVDAVQRIWDRGDAVLPLDRRAPSAHRAVVMAALRPTSLIDADGEHPLEGDEVEPDDALVMPTSGSTGIPKGVVHTHSGLRASAVATSARLGVTSADRWLACLPLAHIGGFSVITKALYSGAGLVVHDGFDAAAVEDSARQGVTLVSLVATALRRVEPRLFRTIVLGGSRPPEERPPNVVTTYGMTETGSGIVYDGVPLDGVEVRIAPDGEILVRGQMLLRAYRDGTSPVDTDGWLHTDDSGRLADGRLVVDGRRGDLIVTGGEKVWPDAVERSLAHHPQVAEVAVAGVADDEWGQRVAAWVVPIDPAEPPSLDELRAHVKDTLPATHAPKQLLVVESLPKTALGKVRRTKLRS
jgi:O-succinylbenzoic acid--CoA ligase